MSSGRMEQISACMDTLAVIRYCREEDPAGMEVRGATLGELDTLTELHQLIHIPGWAEGNGNG